MKSQEDVDLQSALDFAHISSRAQVQGVPVTQGKRHWANEWPQGIDDGTDDDSVLSVKPGELIKPEADRRVEYKEYRPAIKGQWPYKPIDDGTDDDTVVHAQKESGMEIESFHI